MYMQIGILLHIVEENNTKVNSHIETDKYVKAKMSIKIKNIIKLKKIMPTMTL